MDQELPPSDRADHVGVEASALPTKRLHPGAIKFKDKALAWRRRAAEATADFYSFLHEVDRSGEWKAWNFATFDEVLSCLEIGKPHRYRRYLACCEELGSEDTVRLIGMDMAEALAAIPFSAMSRLDPSSKARDRALEEAISFRRRHNTVPSEQTAREIRKKHQARAKKSEDEESPLVTLTRENKSLKRRIKELEVENASLREQLSAAQEGGPARSTGNKSNYASGRTKTTTNKVGQKTR